jgi:uncharacterized protein (UPF0335 family)
MSDAVTIPRAEWQKRLREQNESGDRFIRSVATELRTAPSRAPAREDEGSAGDGEGGGAPRFAKDQLKAFVERIERLQEEKKAIGDDIAEIYAEAKANGFDKKALREVVRLRAQDVNERKEHEAILETYLHALGMLD